jgi:hypothetical protein
MLNARRIALCTMLALILGIGSFTVATVGFPAKAEAATCPTCRGTGQSSQKCIYCVNGIVKGTKTVKCTSCKGSGWKPCATCRGTGQK